MEPTEHFKAHSPVGSALFLGRVDVGVDDDGLRIAGVRARYGDYRAVRLVYRALLLGGIAAFIVAIVAQWMPALTCSLALLAAAVADVVLGRMAFHARATKETLVIPRASILDVIASTVGPPVSSGRFWVRLMFFGLLAPFGFDPGVAITFETPDGEPGRIRLGFEDEEDAEHLLRLLRRSAA